MTFKYKRGYTKKPNDCKYFNKEEGTCVKTAMYGETCPSMIEYNAANENNVPCDMAGYISKED